MIFAIDRKFIFCYRRTRKKKGGEIFTMAQKSTISQLANTAKNRIRQGYGFRGNAALKIDPKRIYSAERTTVFSSDVVDCYRIYDAILRAEKSVESPLKLLIDYDYFERLGQEEKQRYIFKLSEAYISVKRQLEDKRGVK